MIIDVIIPALDEERALPHVLRDIPREQVRRVVVADNGSRDATAEVARAGGADVVHQPERGYGAACLAALDEISGDPPDVVVFLDGDHSDDASQLPALIEPIASGRAEMVLGSRVRDAERGSLTPQQRVGNAIACAALRGLYGARYTDLGPFRAITWDALERLEMRDRNYGWTVEMQIKAAQRGVRHAEIPCALPTPHRRLQSERDLARHRWREREDPRAAGALCAPGAKVIDARIAIFAREPTPGRTKTRLIPALGPEGAAALHAAFIDDTLAHARDALRAEGFRGEVTIYAAELPAPELRRRAAEAGIELVAQDGAGLGERMMAALTRELALAPTVALIGTDAPTLRPRAIRGTLRRLAAAPSGAFVLAPAADGGFWMVAAQERAPSFAGMRVGTRHARADVLAANRPHASLSAPLGFDVDRPLDLRLLRLLLAEDPRRAPATAAALTGLS